MTQPRDQVYPVQKLKYVSGHRPQVACILCAVAEGNPEVVGLAIARTDLFLVSANLYPYNTGHLMIFPLRHLEDVAAYSDDEALQLHHLQVKCMGVLRRLYQPGGFNIGYNLGRVGGASIEHVHLHVVPRWPNEAGFMDMLNGTRIIVEEPAETVRRIRAVWEEGAG